MRLNNKQPENLADSGVLLSKRPADVLQRRNRKNTAAFTLIEVVISTAIVALIFGGIITSYIQSGKRLEWTGYSMAAQQMANSVLEQAKSGVWDPTIPENDLTNLNLLSPTYTASNNLYTYTGYTTGILDVPYASTNYVMATSYLTAQLVNVSTNVQVQFLRVDTVWPFGEWSSMKLYTNTVVTMIAPDNRSTASF